MYIFDKYRYGYNAYKRGYSESYNPQNQALSNELKCITYYLKNEGYTLEAVNEYMLKQLNSIYFFIKDNSMYIKNRLKMIEREYNLDAVNIRFCQKEVDFLKSYHKNEARVIFYIMCVYKLYGRKDIDLVNKDVRLSYMNVFNRDTVNKAIRRISEDNIITYEMLHTKKDVKFITTISDTITDMYDGNYIYEFRNIGNLKLLFNHIVLGYKNIILCEHCGVILEETKNKKYCDICLYENNLASKRLWKNSR